MFIKYSLPLNPRNCSRMFQTDADTIVIGRNRFAGAQIDVNLSKDEYVSDVHARISFENGQYWITDLGSSDGTFVNGKEVTTRKRIIPGDKVQVGGTIIEIHMELAPSDPVATRAATDAREDAGPNRPGKTAPVDFGPDDTTIVNSTDFQRYIKGLPERTAPDTGGDRSMDQRLPDGGGGEDELLANLTGQFPPKKIAWMKKEGHRRQIKGERIDPVTILVTNIFNFTALSWGMDPQEVVGMLNEMFNRYVSILFYYDGIVANFMGDSVLAVFGNPDPAASQWEKAVKAALDIQRATGVLQEDRRRRHLPAFDVGIGLHTGAVIHGFMGSDERMAYAVVGDTANRAIHYCDGADPGDIVISKEVYDRVRPFVKARPIVIKARHTGSGSDLDGYVVEGLRPKGGG